MKEFYDQASLLSLFWEKFKEMGWVEDEWSEGRKAKWDKAISEGEITIIVYDDDK